MMACTADHLVASPFAVLGSIGVISEVRGFTLSLEVLLFTVESNLRQSLSFSVKVSVMPICRASL